MACLKPVAFRGRYAPCSRCLACRRSRAAVLVTRLQVEALAHERVSMVTLTYAPEHLPSGASLVPAHVAGAVMRLRRSWDYHGGGRGLRLFTVGEYGEKSSRPHYHLTVFGADRSTVVGGRSFLELLEAAWPYGRVDPGKVWTPAAAAYVAGYVSKGHNVRGLRLLEGRHPEYSRFPSRQGLGVPGLPYLLPLLIGERDARQVIAAHGDLPSIVPLGGRDRVLGGYLLDKLRLSSGLSLSQLRALKARLAAAESGALHERFLDRLLGQAFAASDFDLAALVSSKLESIDALL